MAAEVESLFYVGRQKPWHGLGTQIDNPPTSKEAIVAAGLDWTVDSRPIFDSTGLEIAGYRANVRESDNKVLGIVSGRYSIVQNSEAFDFTDSLVAESDMVYETAGSLRGGKQIWLLGKMPTTKILDDDFEPYVCFTNTHDGEGSIRVCLTPTRVVCMNTLNLALSHAKRSWSTRHIGDMQSKLIEAQHTLGLINDYTDALKLEAERLAELKISDNEVESILDLIYNPKPEDSDIRRFRIEKAKENFFTCLAAPDIKKYKGTAFAVVNAAADLVDHGEPMRKTADFNANRWGQIIVGHPFVDQIHKQVG